LEPLTLTEKELVASPRAALPELEACLDVDQVPRGLDVAAPDGVLDQWC